MEYNGLAGFFNKLREIIEAAETPFAKLAVFILPILSPLVPASFTGLHIYKLLLELFTFSNSQFYASFLSGIVALVLEMIGYVGAISFVHSVFKWIRSQEDGYILPATLDGLAYTFYLVAMFLINYQLGKYFQTPTIVNNIVGLLSFITVPTSLLAANHLSQKEEKEDEYALRQENRIDRLERYKIKHGANEQFTERTPNVRRTKRTNTKRTGTNDVRSQIEQYVANVQANEHRTPGPSEVARSLGVSKGYASDTLRIILKEQDGE